MNLLLSLAIILPVATLLLLLRIIHASRQQKLIAKTRPIIGLTGIAETDLNYDGLVLIENEVWRAEASSAIARGTRVRVVATNGVLLRVEQESGARDQGSGIRDQGSGIRGQ